MTKARLRGSKTFAKSAGADAQTAMYTSVLKERGGEIRELLASGAVHDMLTAYYSGAFDRYIDEPMHKAQAPTRQGVALAHLDIGDIGSKAHLPLSRPIGLDWADMDYVAAAFPILPLIYRTRLMQIEQFLHWEDREYLPGFQLRFKNRSKKISEKDQERFTRLTTFLLNCGEVTDPRERKRIGRDDLVDFTKKHLKDSLKFDHAPIELVLNPMGKFVGWVAPDARRIYLADPNTGVQATYPEGFQPPFNQLMGPQAHVGDMSDVLAVYTKDGQVTGFYTYKTMLYHVRNPTSDENYYGYGQPEIEDLLRVAAAFMNAWTVNENSITDNPIPRGILALFGQFDPKVMQGFKQDVTAQLSGATNRYRIPMLWSDETEGGGGKAQWISTGEPVNDQIYAKWIMLLIALACAMYGIDPTEIALEGYTSGTTSPLSGTDTEERITASKDRGLRTLLSFLQRNLNEILSIIDPEVELVWTGLDISREEWFEEQEKIALFGEARQMNGRTTEGIPEELLNAPMNSALLTIYQQVLQAKQQEKMQAQAAQQGQQPPPTDQSGDHPPEATEGPNGERRLQDHEGGNWQVPHDQSPPQQTQVGSDAVKDVLRKAMASLETLGFSTALD